MTGPIDTAHVDVVPDVGRFAARLKRDLDAALTKVRVSPIKVPPLKAKIDDGVLDASLKKARTRIGDEGHHAGLGYRVGFARGFLSKLGGLFSPLGETVPLVGAIGKILGGQLATSMKLALFAGIGSLATDLVTLLLPTVGAVALLPAAAFAAVSAFAALKIAFSGVGDALKAGLSGDAAKLAEAMKHLAPEAQATVKAIVALKPQLDALKKTVQGAFFAGLATDVKVLGGTYLPVLRSELAFVADGFGRTVREIAGMAATPRFVADVTAAFSLTGAAIRNMNAVLPGLISGFTTIATVGASFLPGLTSGFRDAGDAFAAFIERTRISGGLEKFISGGLSALGDVAQLLGQLGSIVGSVLTAASGAGTGLISIVKTLADFLKTAEGAGALQAVFAGLASIGQSLGGALGTLLPVAGQVLASLAPLLAMVVSTLAPALAAALTDLAPLLGLFSFVGPLSSAIASLLPIVGQLAGAIGSGLADAVGALVPGLQILAGSLTTALAPVLPVLVSLFQTLAPVVASLGTTLATLLAPVLSVVSSLLVELGPVVGEVASVLGQVLLAALTALQPLLDALAPAFAQWAHDLFPALIPLVNQFGELLMALLPALGPLVDLMVALLPTVMELSQGFKVMLPVLTFLVQAITIGTEATSAFVGAIAGLVASFVNWLSAGQGLVSGFFGIGETLRGLFGSLVGAVAGFGEAVTMWFFSLPGRIGAALATLPGVLVAAINTAFGAALFALGFALGTAVRLVTELPGRVGAALSTLGGLLVSLWNAAWAAATAAIRAGINSAVSFVATLPVRVGAAVSAIPGILSNAWNTAFAVARNAVAAGINALGALLSSLPGRASSALAGVRGAVLGALAGAGSWLAAAGGNLIDGLIGGVKNAVGRAIDAVKRAMGDIVAGAKRALGIGSPSKLFADQVGRWIPEGVAVGVDRNIDAARRAIGDLLSPTSLGGVAPPSRGGADATTTTATAAPPPPAAADAAPVIVHVYLGDRELTDIVDVRIETRDRALKRRVLAGSGRM